MFCGWLPPGTTCCSVRGVPSPVQFRPPRTTSACAGRASAINMLAASNSFLMSVPCELMDGLHRHQSGHGTSFLAKHVPPTLLSGISVRRLADDLARKIAPSQDRAFAADPGMAQAHSVALGDGRNVFAARLFAVALLANELAVIQLV